MQVVSGPIGKEHVHFEAPGADRVAGEMTSFLHWFEGQELGGNASVELVLRAGLAHLWLFLGCLDRSIDGARVTLSAVLAKARFWERIRQVQLNDRQRPVLNRLLDGFEGKLTTSKYAKLSKCSQDAAHRDILWLIENGIVVRNSGGGRSTSYSLVK